MALTDTDLDQVSEALDAALSPLVHDGRPPGLTWGIDVDGERRTGALGHLDLDATTPARVDTIFRISSMTKPVSAAAALTLIEEGVLALDQPVADLLPELADPQVLVRPDAPLAQTVPAHRQITVEDLLTFRLGHGMDFTTMGRASPLDDHLARTGLAVGPPAPLEHAAPDDWLAALAEVPLRHQPGERWLYNTGSEVLSVLLGRARGTSLGEVLRQQLLDPLDMSDTGFWVPQDARHRFGAAFVDDGPQAGGLSVFDPPGGQWSQPPVFEGGDGGLVSTVGDYLSFAVLLRDGGTAGDRQLLTPDSIRAMTTNHLTDEQLAAGGPSPDGGTGWGLGVGVTLAAPTPGVVGSYGWDGGLGSTWRNDSARGLSAVLLTSQLWNSPTPPAVAETFWSTLAETLPLPT